MLRERARNTRRGVTVDMEVSRRVGLRVQRSTTGDLLTYMLGRTEKALRKCHFFALLIRAFLYLSGCQRAG